MIIFILSVTILLFIWGKFPPDIVALISMLSLFLSGILTAEETLSGFSNPTVIMIGSLFIVGEGLAQTGWTALAGKKLIEWSKGSITNLLTYLSLGSGMLSGFVSNTGTVATLLPVTIAASWNIGTLPSKMLIPVAFGSNTGGLLTLTGTPPNIIVSNALSENGLEAFSFFEFGLIGLPLLIIVTLYFKYVGTKVLPSNKTKNEPVNLESEMIRWMESYNLKEGYFRLKVSSDSLLPEKKLKKWEIDKEYNLIITRVKRSKDKRIKYIDNPSGEFTIKQGDTITVKADLEEVERFMKKFNLSMEVETGLVDDAIKEQIISHEIGMAEVIIVPKSMLVGREISIGEYFGQFGIQLLGGSRDNEPITEKEIRVHAGDAFLIRGKWSKIEKLMEFHKNLVIYGNLQGMASSVPSLSRKSAVSLFALILMVALMVFKVVPNAIAVLIAAGLVILSACIPMSKIYDGISWRSVIMIAAMIPMGLALQKTGVAQAAADGLVVSLGAIHPILMLSGVFLLTSMFSQVINNSATAVLMAPIAILAAGSLGVSAKPFMVAVAVSASTAFLTPVGTTTNAMVMAAGGYKFGDYLKAGTPLLLIFLLVSLVLIPLIWPI